MESETSSQPSQQTSVEQSKNPIDQSSAEQESASNNSTQDAPTTETRSVPSHGTAEESEPTQTSLGYGERGPLKERDISESDKQNYSKQGDLEGEQMRAPGEGEVADAVQGKASNPNSGHGEEESLTSNMEAKADAHEEQLRKRGESLGGSSEQDEDWTGLRNKVDLNAALGREGQEGEVTAVGETERGTGVVLAAENATGTTTSNDD